MHDVAILLAEDPYPLALSVSQRLDGVAMQRRAVEQVMRFGGQLVDFVDDALLAVFPVMRHALNAADGIREIYHTNGEDLGGRVMLHFAKLDYSSALSGELVERPESQIALNTLHALSRNGYFISDSFKSRLPLDQQRRFTRRTFSDGPISGWIERATESPSSREPTIGTLLNDLSREWQPMRDAIFGKSATSTRPSSQPVRKDPGSDPISVSVRDAVAEMSDWAERGFTKSPAEDKILEWLAGYSEPVTVAAMADQFNLTRQRARRLMNRLAGKGLVHALPHDHFVITDSAALVEADIHREEMIRQKFLGHALTYGAVNAGLIGMELITGQLPLSWSLIVATGWGIGLVSHAGEWFNARALVRRFRKLKKRLTTPVVNLVRKAEAKLAAFRSHAAAYLGVNALLYTIDLTLSAAGAGSGISFAHWVSLGWGIGLGAHGLNTLRQSSKDELAISQAGTQQVRRYVEFVMPEDIQRHPWRSATADAVSSLQSLKVMLDRQRRDPAGAALDDEDPYQLAAGYYETVLQLGRKGDHLDAMLEKIHPDGLRREHAELKAKVDAEPTHRHAEDRLQRMLLIERQLKLIQTLADQREAATLKQKNLSTHIQTLSLELSQAMLHDETTRVETLLAQGRDELHNYQDWFGEAMTEIDALLNRPEQ